MKLLVVAVVAVLVNSGLGSQISVIIPKENSFFDLRCPETTGVKYWLLHGEGKAYFPQEYTEEKLTVYANGSIIFQSIKLEYAGTHLCIRNPSDDDIMAHSVTLKVRPQPSDNLWADVYESQFLTGLIAALVCFSIFALSCFVYNKRWRPAAESDITPIVENGYDNPAMASTEEEDSSSTKM